MKKRILQIIKNDQCRSLGEKSNNSMKKIFFMSQKDLLRQKT